MPTTDSRQIVLGFTLAAAVLPGCSITGPGGEAEFNAVNPRDRMSAAVVAAERGDERAVPDLIDMLDASDPGSRFVAARALVQITGQDHGYDPFSPDDQRAEAAQRWADWYAAEHPREDASE